MKKRLLLTASVIAIAAFAIVPFVYAAPHGRGQGFHGGRGGAGGGFGMFGHLARAKEELGLSDQHVDEIKAIFAENREQNQQYREQLHGGMKAVAEKLLANPNDIAGAQAVIDAQASAQAAMKANFLQATSKALNVLNADQRAKLATMLENHEQRWQRRRQ